MKFRNKLFLGVMLILTVSLAFAEYYTVFATFKTGIEHVTEDAMRKHQLIKYALQADLIAAGDDDPRVIDRIVERTRQGFDMDFSLYLSTKREDEDYLYYSILEWDEEQYIIVESTFLWKEQVLALESVEKISYIFREAEQLKKNCRIAFAETIVVGLLLSALLAFGLTYPIKRLNRASREYAEGHFERRVAPMSHDEVGELTVSFNRMADSIEEKIEDLELAVRQREDFVAGFAHEIKTPMTGIIGYADTLYQRDMDPEEVKEYAGYILNEGLRLEALSFKLLDLVALGRREFLLEEMSMPEVLEDVRQTARAMAEKRGILFAVVHADEGYCRIECDLFKTMLLNLIDNGLKAGGSKVMLVGRREGNEYIVTVSDDGRGIPAGELERITEAFYMVDKSRSRKEHGAGLGLALCERIAQVHGAHLVFDSRVGSGTEVSVTLQAVGEEGTV